MTKGGYSILEIFFEVMNTVDFLNIESGESSHGHELYEHKWILPGGEEVVLPAFLSSHTKDHVGRIVYHANA